MTKILLLILLMSGCIQAYYTPDTYLIINPSIKILKEENGNGALDVVFGNGKLQINNKFSVSGIVSVGFTSPRSNIISYNHYVNTFLAKATWRPIRGLGIGIESSWSHMIKGNDSEVSYFRDATYQAIVIEIDQLMILNFKE